MSVSVFFGIVLVAFASALAITAFVRFNHFNKTHRNPDKLK